MTAARAQAFPLPASSDRHMLFPAVIKAIASKPLLNVLEVGSFMGESAMAWAKALNTQGRHGRVICVDPWKPYMRDFDVRNNSMVFKQNILMEDGDVKTGFDRNTATPPEGVTIIPIRAKFADIAGLLALCAFDVIYIDGSHYYEDVRDDIAAAHLLLHPDGILCGDDLEYHPSRCGAVPPEFLKHDTIMALDGSWYHPGVCKAVGEAFSHETIHCLGGFWWIAEPIKVAA